MGERAGTPAGHQEHQGQEPHEGACRGGAPGLPDFTLQAIRKARSALCRQVCEVVNISSFKGHTILNNKEEYNSCILPSITFQGRKVGGSHKHSGGSSDKLWNRSFFNNISSRRGEGLLACFGPAHAQPDLKDSPIHSPSFVMERQGVDRFIFF